MIFFENAGVMCLWRTEIPKGRLSRMRGIPGRVAKATNTRHVSSRRHVICLSFVRILWSTRRSRIPRLDRGHDLGWITGRCSPSHSSILNYNHPPPASACSTRSNASCCSPYTMIPVQNIAKLTASTVNARGAQGLARNQSLPNLRPNDPLAIFMVRTSLHFSGCLVAS